jgi:hypothetical protein
MPLTDTAIRTIKPADRAVKHSDSGGLSLLQQPTGGKLWRMDYRHAGKRRTLALGAYPAVSLKDARARRDEAKKLLANGQDPGEVKKAQKAAKEAPTSALGRGWIVTVAVALTDLAVTPLDEHLAHDPAAESGQPAGIGVAARCLPLWKPCPAAM